MLCRRSKKINGTKLRLIRCPTTWFEIEVEIQFQIEIEIGIEFELIIEADIPCLDSVSGD